MALSNWGGFRLVVIQSGCTCLHIFSGVRLRGHPESPQNFLGKGLSRGFLFLDFDCYVGFQTHLHCLHWVEGFVFFSKRFWDDSNWHLVSIYNLKQQKWNAFTEVSPSWIFNKAFNAPFFGKDIVQFLPSSRRQFLMYSATLTAIKVCRFAPRAPLEAPWQTPWQW